MKNPMDANEREKSGLLLGSEPLKEIRYRASSDKKDGLGGDTGDDDSSDSDKADSDATDSGDTGDDSQDTDGKD